MRQAMSKRARMLAELVETNITSRPGMTVIEISPTYWRSWQQPNWRR